MNECNNLKCIGAKLTFFAQVPCIFFVLTGCVFASAAHRFRAIDMNILIRSALTTFDPTGQEDRPFFWQLLKVCAVLFIPQNKTEILKNYYVSVCSPVHFQLFIPVCTEASCLWSNKFAIYLSRDTKTDIKAVLHSSWHHCLFVYLVLILRKQPSSIIFPNNPLQIIMVIEK